VYLYTLTFHELVREGVKTSKPLNPKPYMEPFLDLTLREAGFRGLGEP
jgi:hypothetical protein